MTRQPGIYTDCSAAEYHADPAPQPSLNASIAKVLVDQAPYAAWWQHPRLNDAPQEESDPTRPKDIGTALHKMILGRGRDIDAIAASDYKTKDARDRRAAAYAAGKCPLLEPDLEKVSNMVFTVKAQLAGRREAHGLLNPSGGTEVVVIAAENGVFTRCMIDALDQQAEHVTIWDVKTGAQSAAPHLLPRRVLGMGFDLAAAHYVEVLSNARPDWRGRIRYRWLFVENDPPHLLTIAEPDAMMLEFGLRKAMQARRLWSECLDAGWPGYAPIIHRVAMPAWSEKDWLDREVADEERRTSGAIGGPTVMDILP